MNCMATLKHIASKNSDYTAIEAYLVYQHDAFTGKQLLDEQGRPKLRESYILDTLECGDFSFAMACLLANRKYGKNTRHGDIKSHQYIISFDPKDAADNGLTMEKAQALGLKFCEENFPGHPAIVCTHPDGHNHSGNIHVHIVIGSVRTREVERKPYMQIAIVCGFWQGAPCFFFVIHPMYQTAYSYGWNRVNLTQFLSTAARIPRTPLISKSFFFLVLQQKPQNDFQACGQAGDIPHSCRVCARPPSMVPMVLAGMPSDSGMLLSVELGVSSGSRPVKVRMISLLFAVN